MHSILRTTSAHPGVYAVFFFVLCTGVFFGMSNITGAQERSSAVEQQRAAQARTEAFRSAVQKKREELQAQQSVLSRGTLDQAYSLLVAIFEHTNGAIERLQGIADRMESRAQKITASNGADVSEANKSVDEARERLTQAQQALDSLRTQAHAAVVSEYPTERLIEARSVMEDVGSDVRAAHQTLNAALRELKEAAQKAAEHTEFPIDTSELRVQ